MEIPLNLRERFAIWLCEPALGSILSVIKSTRKIIEGYDSQIEAQQQQIEGLKLLCEGLANDLNATLGELRSQQAEQSERPRVRIARNFAAFSEAATIAARKGATK